VDPADFYTGIVADIYGPLKSSAEGPELYAWLVSETGEPALELGCGDGDPLLGLIRRGLDVEGVDSSADMLERCRQRAAAEGLAAVLHHQRMEALDLPRRYRSVYLAGPTFILLPNDELALRALSGIRAHLEPGGLAFVPLWIPPATPPEDIGRVRSAVAPDGAELRVSVVAEERDEQTRTRTTILRYERLQAENATVVERPWVLHWHTPEGFERLIAKAGLTTVPLPDRLRERFAANPGEFAYLLRIADRDGHPPG
jgi:SAM-dependent methyltransferase